MVRIETHTIPDISDESAFRSFEKRMQEVIPGAARSNLGEGLGLFVDAFISDAGCFVAAGNVVEARRRLMASGRCGYAVFAPVGPDGLVHFRFDGRDLSGPRPTIPGYANTLTWIKTFCLASSFRDEECLGALDAYDKATLAKAPTGSFDLYAIALAEGMRALRRNDPKWPELLDEAEFRSRPENLRIASPSIIARFRALIPMLQCIGRNDQEGFDKACVEAVMAHKNFYGRGKKKDDPDGAYAYMAAGIAAMGVDRGLKYNVDCGYTPRWLVSGGEP